MTPFEHGFTIGQIKRDNPDYDARWDFADAAKQPDFAEFKRGFTEGVQSNGQA